MVLESVPFCFVRNKQGAHKEQEAKAKNKSLMKQEIVPQGTYLLLFCAVLHLLLNLVDCLHQRFNIQVGVDTFGERHGTGVSHNLLNHGLVYMGLYQHGDGGVPGTVRRLVTSNRFCQGGNNCGSSSCRS